MSIPWKILGCLILFSITGCGQLKGPQGDAGSTGRTGDSGDQGQQGIPGLPGPECAFFCHGTTKLYIRCDGHADVIITVKKCEGEQG